MGLTSAASLAGKEVGNWGFGNEFELFAGLQKAGVDPKSGVTLVQQQFDMAALLSKQIDAAQAMIYNEYAQVLEQKNPATGAVPADRPQRHRLEQGRRRHASGRHLGQHRQAEEPHGLPGHRGQLLKGAIGGWVYCRDNFQPCVDIVLRTAPRWGPRTRPGAGPGERLVWPSPGGIGVVDKALWDQTVSVATSQKVMAVAPDADAYSNAYVQKAVDALKAGGMDVTGSSYKAPQVTLKEGGK